MMASTDEEVMYYMNYGSIFIKGIIGWKWQEQSLFTQVMQDLDQRQTALRRDSAMAGYHSPVTCKVV